MGTRLNRLAEAVLTSTHNICFEQKYNEFYQEYLSETFPSLVVKFSIYLNGRVFVMLELHQEIRMKFRASKTGLRPKKFSYWRLICCKSSLFVRRWSQLWRLFCPYLFVISPSFGTSEGMCFVIVAFSVYIYLYFCGLTFSLFKQSSENFH